MLVVLALVALRIALPYVLESVINRRLQNIPDYSGSVRDIDLHLWRGAYQLEEVEIRKTSGALSEPLFAAKKIDFSLAWRDLFRGRIVGDIELDEAALTLVSGPTAESSQKEGDRRWQDVIEDLFPIEITRLEIDDSVIRFLDTTADPKVDIEIHDLDATITGLRNRRKATEEGMPAHVMIEGTTIGDGDLRLMGGVDLLAEQPRFKLDLELRDVDLRELNEFLLAYANVDVSRGKFQLFLEVAAGDGRYEGYIKPFFEDLDFKNVTDENKPVTQRIWENIVGALAHLVKNKPRDQVATRIPFAGEFGDADVGLLAAIGNLLRHGFGQALAERLEGDLFTPDEGGVLKPSEDTKERSVEEPLDPRNEDAPPLRPEGRP